MNKLLMDMISPYAYTFHACPYKPMEHFSIKDFIVKQNSLPVVIPLGEYRLDLEFLRDEDERTRYILVQSFFVAKNVF